MATYVLVHGGWCGAWCWEKIVPGLESDGHRVITFDLPGHGNDNVPIEKVTLEDYVEALSAAVAQADEPVILVAHSMGGIVISQYAELNPDRVEKLVYVTAFLINDGDKMFDRVMSDADSSITPESTEITENGIITLKPEFGRDIGFAECSEADMMRAVSLMKPDSIIPWQQPLHLTQGTFGSIPKIYIHTLNDHANTISAQRQMVADWPCEQIYELDGDHAVWYSRPNELTAALLAIGEPDDF